MRIRTLFAFIVGVLGSSGADARPRRAEILKHAIHCGFSTENLVFSVDDEGVDNADVYPLGKVDDSYQKKVECLMGWAAGSGAAIGFHFEMRTK